MYRIFDITGKSQDRVLMCLNSKPEFENVVPDRPRIQITNFSLNCLSKYARKHFYGGLIFKSKEKTSKNIRKFRHKTP